MKKSTIFLLPCILILGCSSLHMAKKHGKAYQKNMDYKSLSKAVGLIPLQSDTSYVRSILGEPIDMGFDFRYLIDSVGSNGCPIGAVFHLHDNGKVDQKWIDEICE